MGRKLLSLVIAGTLLTAQPLLVHADNLEDVIAKKAAEQKKLQDQQRQEAEAQNARMTRATGLESKLPKPPSPDDLPSSMIPGKEGHYVPYDWKIKQMAEKQNPVLHPVAAPSIEVGAPPGVQLKQYRTLAEAAADGVNPLQPKAAASSGSNIYSGVLLALILGVLSFGAYQVQRRFDLKRVFNQVFKRKGHGSDTQ